VPLLVKAHQHLVELVELLFARRLGTPLPEDPLARGVLVAAAAARGGRHETQREQPLQQSFVIRSILRLAAQGAQQLGIEFARNGPQAHAVCEFRIAAMTMTRRSGRFTTSKQCGRSRLN
jgi:hypothetical protein